MNEFKPQALAKDAKHDEAEYAKERVENSPLELLRRRFLVPRPNTPFSSTIKSHSEEVTADATNKTGDIVDPA